jgi:hypothetical protein
VGIWRILSRYVKVLGRGGIGGVLGIFEGIKS